MPKYYKDLKPQANEHPQSSTAKRCIPFLEALSQGFIIPFWCDVYVKSFDGEITIDFPQSFASNYTLESHSYEQIKDHPLKNSTYGRIPMKWMNPWVIKTEKNVSCLFTSPLNHMETRFKVIDGVVDTDNYKAPINFPFIWTGGDGEFIFKKGTPLIQVIPFYRQTFSVSVSELDEKEVDKTRSILGTQMNNGYRDNFWHKKTASEQEQF